MTRQQGKDELFNKWGHNSPLEKKKKKACMYTSYTKSNAKVVQRLKCRKGNYKIKFRYTLL